MESYSDKISWSLDQKIFHLFEVLDVFYHRMDGKVYLNFSGGKDSTVLKYFIDKWTDLNGYPRARCLFNNTTNEYAEILDFVKSFGDSVEWTRPEMTFAQTLQKHGYPVVSKHTSRFIHKYKRTKDPLMKRFYKHGIMRTGEKSAFKIAAKWHYLIAAPFSTTDKCCNVLKKQPIKAFERETKLKPITGVMSTESNQRKIWYIKNGGCNVWKEGKEMCMPLSLFTEDNIWECIARFDIDICSVYYDQEIDGETVTGEKRTGCAYCAFGAHCEDPKNNRFTRLYKREPKRYKSFMDKLGYRDVLNYLGIELPDSQIFAKQINQYNMEKKMNISLDVDLSDKRQAKALSNFALEMAGLKVGPTMDLATGPDETVVEEKPKKTRSKKAAPKKEEAPIEEKEEAPIEEKEEAPTEEKAAPPKKEAPKKETATDDSAIDLAALRGKASEILKGDSSKRPDIKAKLEGYGVSSVSTLEEEKYEEFYKFLKSLA